MAAPPPYDAALGLLETLGLVAAARVGKVAPAHVLPRPAGEVWSSLTARAHPSSAVHQDELVRGLRAGRT